MSRGGKAAKVIGGIGILLMFAAGSTEEGREAQMIVTGVIGVLMTLPMFAEFRREERRREREDHEEFSRYIDRAVRNL